MDESMNWDVKEHLKVKHLAFVSGDMERLRSAQFSLKNAVKMPKLNIKTKLRKFLKRDMLGN